MSRTTAHRPVHPWRYVTGTLVILVVGALALTACAGSGATPAPSSTEPAAAEQPAAEAPAGRRRSQGLQRIASLW